MKLASILPQEAVLPCLAARDKKQAIRLMAARAAMLTGLSEKEIYSVLMEREDQGCTGMGNGVCIPHGRFEKLEGLHALFAHMEKPIPFGSEDGKPVDLIFLLLTPTSANTEHLKALAIVSRLLRDKQRCDSLRKTTDAKVMHTLLVAANGASDALST